MFGFMFARNIAFGTSLRGLEQDTPRADIYYLRVARVRDRRKGERRRRGTGSRAFAEVNKINYHCHGFLWMMTWSASTNPESWLNKQAIIPFWHLALAKTYHAQNGIVAISP